MDYKIKGQQLVYSIFDPIVKMMVSIGLKPNHITLIGLLLNSWATIYLINYFNFSTAILGDRLIGFGLIIGFAGLMDMLDGRMARLYDLKSTFGAFFDSVIDRYSEFIMFLGLMVYQILQGNYTGVIITFLALMGSIMVSYARSRAETLGVNCSIGLMQRPERIIFVALWSILFGFLYYKGYTDNEYLISGLTIYVMGYAFLAISTNITAIRRIIHTSQALGKS